MKSSIIFGLLLGQLLLALFDIKTPEEGFVDWFWQVSGFFACWWLTVRKEVNRKDT